MEEQKCKVHDTTLIPMKVGISYGLPYFADGEIEARRNLFPNAKSFVLGGCEVGTSQNSDVLVCEECRKAEKVWKETQRQNKKSK